MANPGCSAASRCCAAATAACGGQSRVASRATGRIPRTALHRKTASAPSTSADRQPHLALRPGPAAGAPGRRRRRPQRSTAASASHRPCRTNRFADVAQTTSPSMSRIRPSSIACVVPLGAREDLLQAIAMLDAGQRGLDRDPRLAPAQRADRRRALAGSGMARDIHSGHRDRVGGDSRDFRRRGDEQLEHAIAAVLEQRRSIRAGSRRHPATACAGAARRPPGAPMRVPPGHRARRARACVSNRPSP